MTALEKPRTAALQPGGLVLFVSILLQAVALGLPVYCFALLVLPWSEEFGVAVSTVMWAIFGLQIGIGICSPFAGRLMDRYRLSTLVLLGCLSGVAGLMLIAWSPDFAWVAAAYVLLLPPAMALSGTLAAQTMVSRVFTEKRALAMGVSAVGTSIGGVVFPQTMAWMMTLGDWRAGLVQLTLAAYAILVPAAFFVLRRFERNLGVPVPNMQASTQVATSWQAVLRNALFWLPLCVLLPLNLSFGGLSFNFGNYVRDAAQPDWLTAELVSATAIGTFTGKLLFGWLGQKLADRHLLALAGLVMASGVLALGLASGRPGFLLAAALMGTAAGSQMPIIGTIYASRFGPSRFASVVGFVNLVLMFGAFGSILVGWSRETTGSYDPVLLAFGMVLLLGVFISQRLRGGRADV